MQCLLSQYCTHKPIWHIIVATITGIVEKDVCQNHLVEYVAQFGDDVINVEIERNYG